MTAPDLDQDRSDAQHKKAGEVEATPLPWSQLLIVFLVQFAEPITATVIYPFINQFVRATGVTRGDETKTGYFGGIIESVFFFAEALTVVFWGMASDQLGRRSVLIFGPLGLSISMLGFGASTRFWSLVVFRCFQGIFNGNIGVAKTVIGEITDRTNIAKAFAYVPVMWTIGIALAPVIGGVFTRPAVRWPDTLGKSAYLRDHPYFLPCFIASAVAFLAFLGAFVGLKETLPSALLRQKEKKLHPGPTSSTNLLDDSDAPHYFSIGGTVERRGDSLTELENGAQASPPRVFSRALLTPRVVAALINQAFVTFCDMSVQVLVPLLWSTSLEHGGLGFSSYTIGLTLGIYGIVNVLFQITFLGKFVQRFSPRTVYIVSFWVFLVTLSCLPLEGYLARRAGAVDWKVWTVIVFHLIIDCMRFGAYVAIHVFITDSAPSQSVLGAVNGLGHAVGCVTRSLAPTVASSLFAISLQRNWAGGNAVFYILMGIVVCGIRSSFMLPKTLQLR